MDNLNELERFIKESVNDRWICVELRLIGFEDEGVPESLINEVKSAPFDKLNQMLNRFEVVFTFDGCYHAAKRFTATEVAAIPNLQGLFRAVIREAIFSVATSAFIK